MKLETYLGFFVDIAGRPSNGKRLTSSATSRNDGLLRLASPDGSRSKDLLLSSVPGHGSGG
jgi:hypothetical protein